MQHTRAALYQGKSAKNWWESESIPQAALAVCHAHCKPNSMMTKTQLCPGKDCHTQMVTPPFQQNYKKETCTRPTTLKRLRDIIAYAQKLIQTSLACNLTWMSKKVNMNNEQWWMRNGAFNWIAIPIPLMILSLRVPSQYGPMVAQHQLKLL